MNLLTLNTLSNEDIDTKEEVTRLLLEMALSIKKFLSYDEYKLSRFYTEEKDILEFEIIQNYKFKDAIKLLKREVLEPFSLFLSRKCDTDCLNKITDDELKNILDGDLYFEDEPYDGQKYIILSYCLEKRTFLLSFGKNRWTKYKVVANKVKADGSSEKVVLNNIANKEHVLSHYKDKIIEQLPQENILYSDEFKKLYATDYYADSREKIVDKITESMNSEFRIDGFLVKVIDSDILQIKVGTMGGLQQSAIRILFKKEVNKVYILHIFTKQGESTYDYVPEVTLARTNYTNLSKN
ncbi:hypothetical protein AN286_03335 [Aliarcobacter cryaerophilus ATCC 43158]|uniref:Uncharacterized protein n=1 Tax=Aliarcobacter cryaerophilus ATCC 43158 TaxID=1032070 RepID=A0AAD0TS97_9BACT|nr:hypothetical protein [Aliarcobacter cryaerophilus]AYJ79220.1 hypothetical protein ACRYA_0044 [Aliarcobacter cryaerophilus ATCC 43158]PRM96750.1 hypothetical protein CJ667_07165 [Aliarcobacter cryaerophilus]QCZ23485.1 hypothetical protein AN286_03335 [Aliarcobacter cryaerophilus ATCC 43158]